MIFVNIIVIYDSSNETSIYSCVQLFLNAINLNINIKVTEFFLSKNYFYTECSFNSSKGLNNCNNVNDIISKLNNSDLFILASPIYNCDISSEMKSFLNELSYYYASNKSILLMHNKIGLSILTSAGAGLFHTSKFLKRNLNSLGISNTLNFSKTLYESNWKDINLNTKMKINKEIFKLSYRVLKLYKHKLNIKPLVSPPKKKRTYIKNNSNIVQFDSLKDQSHT